MVFRLRQIDEGQATHGGRLAGARTGLINRGYLGGYGDHYSRPPNPSLLLLFREARNKLACAQIEPTENLVIPPVRPLVSMIELFEWYRINVCETEVTEVRGNRVKFLPENFVHLIKLTNKYGKEPKNA